MRRALLAGALLGAVAGLVLVHRDALRLTVAWPVILGFALWETIGPRGSRGVLAAAAAGVGALLGWATFGVVAEYMPITDGSVGIVAGIVLGLMVAGGVLAKGRFPLVGLLIGYGSFLGVYDPLWRQSPATFRTHGVEHLTITLLALLVGVLSAAVVRALTDGVKETAGLRHRGAGANEPTTPMSELLTGEGGGGQ